MSTVRPALDTKELRRLVARLPRVALAHLPTPLEELPRFSKALGGPPVLIKRDDCTGLAFGGNKARHNEFLMAEALAQGADLVIWGAGVQSNNCRQTAAACAKLGLECRLFLARGRSTDVQGNLLLDHLLGAKVEVVDFPIGPALYEHITAQAAKLRSQGRRVYSWRNETVKPLAAVSYALCVAEMAEQLVERGQRPSAVYVSSAGSTGSGLLLGKAVLGFEAALKIIAPIHWGWDHAQDMAATANKAAALVGLPECVEPADVETSYDYIGDGYALPTPGGREALDLLARTEGIFLDPVYTAKAMAALIDDVRQRRVPSDQPVVFIHTGGTPVLFASREDVLDAGQISNR